jgi:DNA-binding helix-hairpin-helix protein with protein kinase domain/cytochrome c-type biogenesis protein CcmH/NrfG
MPTFYDSSGKPYELSIEIGRGGEGAVFYCPNDSALVAKIYHEPIDDEKSEKLRWMAANRNDQLLKVSAWIVDTLHDKAGFTVGFLMPNVKAKEIHELYSLKSRRVHFPEATWQFLLHAATNVARAFYVLHKNEHIMGDVNHGNCVILADGTVKLIDCDSYSIKTDKMRYRCDVGVATHLAPELQGVELGEVEREKKHDNFGLAVIIFQLLFLGRHPFAGNYLGAEDKSLEDCIREHRFAYWNEAVTRVKQPPGTLSLSQLSPAVADLFKKAFFTEERPEAREWIEALEDLSKSLNQCSVHIGHHYFNGLVACPWCEIESKTGLLLFPFVSGKEFDNEFNIFTVEKLLASLEVPSNLPAKPFKPNIYVAPSSEAIKVYQQNRNALIGMAIVEFWLILCLSAMAPSCGFVLGIIILTTLLSIKHFYLKSDTEKIKSELVDARAGWEYFEKHWQNYGKDKDFLLDIVNIRQKVNDYHLVQKEKQSQTSQLDEANLQYQLVNYLSTFKLEEANLRGLEEDDLKTFRRFGIKTAADFNEARLNALVAVKCEKRTILLRWRKNLEIKFEFDPNAPLPDSIKNNFENQFIEKRRKIEKEIEKLLVPLRSVSTTLRQQQQQMMVKTQSVAQTLAQAESNFAKVNNTVKMTAVMVMIPIVVPIFSSFFFQQSSPKTTFMNNHRQPVIESKSQYNALATPTPVKYEDETSYKVNEKITDTQIAAMPIAEREKAARILHQQGQKLIDAKNFSEAEAKLRLSVRYVDYFANTLYTLSNLLYDVKKYDDSIKFLEKSLKIDGENEYAKLLIGANYLQVKDYEKGEKVFKSVLEKNPESYEANFNIGLIYNKVKNYKLAVTHFEKAVKAKPEDVDAQYEYGISLYKSGDRERAEAQYQFLLNKDEEKAAKLWKIMTKDIPRDKISEGHGIAIDKVSPLPANKATPLPSYARQ